MKPDPEPQTMTLKTAPEPETVMLQLALEHQTVALETEKSPKSSIPLKTAFTRPRKSRHFGTSGGAMRQR
ncbi:hypothetical protein Pst134EA_018931, partial [Puccinia striiformis f. sp. tritici]|uniref:hypothetical protein n=1 Tax=Puccinia striiformis f. sp. tritici TaxID=168172 RepID=UPI0020081B4D